MGKKTAALIGLCIVAFLVYILCQNPMEELSLEEDDDDFYDDFFDEDIEDEEI